MVTHSFSPFGHSHIHTHFIGGNNNQAAAHILFDNGARLSLERAATFLCTAAAEGDCPMLRLLSECGVDTNIGAY